MKNIKRNDGFTIVELLIVIVVIGILAAITIVSYSGITARANTTKAQTNAASAQKVAEAYNADAGYYPPTLAAFTSGFGANPSSKLPSG
ncbi:prepilin-type N-terminal cleavage/methylation domain-containing protein, partial [Candidatus Saccharibacteria bacterium]|nr:prepilin-type N-terminal cleavage/methylation domain-containing protein [Candidatus Saccharibacteria bacterium]